VEAIFAVLDGKGRLLGSRELWRNALKMTWSQEFGINCVSSKYTYWISIMIELGTINVDDGATSSWSSKRRYFRKTWWIEENEFHAITNILVIESQL
jgi:hypothetical protein